MTQTSALLDEVASWFEAIKPNGSGIMARCPAHEDRQQSLSISIGDDGRILLKCFANCETAAVLDRVGKTFSDLFPPDQTQRTKNAGGAKSTLTAYDYVDENGSVLYQALRKQFSDHKEFTQRKREPNGGWEYKLGNVRRVLYRLPDVLQAIEAGEYILIPEGEKDVDRLRALGFNATTNAGGAEKWRDEYSDSLTGAAVVFLCDHDTPGYRHALKAARSLAGKAESIRILCTVGLPDKADVSDYIAMVGDPVARVDIDRIASGQVDSVPGLAAISIDELIERADENAKSSYVHMFGNENAELQEFPVDVFPDVIRRYVEDGAKAINVPPDMIALPLLGFAAGTIGNSCALAVKSGWIERPNVWVAVIGEPGSGKSPAVDYARAPVDALQKTAWEDYQARLVVWQREIEEAKTRKGKEKSKEPLPDKPALEHFFSTDATTQALAAMLVHSPGLTIVRDELVGWVKSHDAYTKAGDRQNYLSLWAGSPLKVDRRGAETVFVPRPCVPIVGGIQPDMLSDLAEEANRRDGFVERILMVWPVAKPQRWTDSDTDPQTVRNVTSIFARLRVRTASPGDAVLHFTPEAKAIFARWFDENGEIVASSSGVAQGCYSKYPGQLARIALILHCLHHPGETSRSVDAGTITSAIEVIEYLRSHLVRILPRFASVGSTKSAGLDSRIVRILSKYRGEWVARRELQKGLGNSVPADDLSTALERMATAGTIENRTVATGARPREETRILDNSPRTNEHMNNSTDDLV